MNVCVLLIMIYFLVAARSKLAIFEEQFCRQLELDSFGGYNTILAPPPLSKGMVEKLV